MARASSLLTRSAPLIVGIALSVAAACAGRPAPDLGDAGEDDVPDAGEADAGILDAGTTADTGSVTWSSDLPNPYLFPGPDDEDGILDNNAYDFFLQYTVELPENNLPPVWLDVSICMQRAVDALPACSSNANVALAGPGGYRWGFDPSQYTSGENIYEHTLSLKRGDDVLVARTLTFEVTAP